MAAKNIILKIENISKQYRLGLVGTGTISHDLNRLWAKVSGKEDPFLTVGAVNDRSSKATEEYVWALKDISIEVQEGEVLGIIGKNGAGKSTLLKILSRVTSPTTGTIKTRGRIASLLEVGTGFHPELTGIENIFLNGAILGMTKAEITDKIKEIVDFSGCELYIDTPVKRYSSGMRVRLAFAVAAHLEPDILVIDEVLAVGDAEFQKKAIGKMQDISKGEGRTVLFVSHNMAAVKSLCTRAIVLENGKNVFDGGTNKAVDFYLKNSNDKTYNFKMNDKKLPCGIIEVESVGVKPINERFDSVIYQDSELVFEVNFNKKTMDQIGLNFRIKDSDENILFTHGSLNQINNKGKIGKFKYKLKTPKNLFNEGNILVDFGCVHNNKFSFLRENYLEFMIYNKAKIVGSYFGKSKGALKLDLIWED